MSKLLHFFGLVVTVALFVAGGVGLANGNEGVFIKCVGGGLFVSAFLYLGEFMQRLSTPRFDKTCARERNTREEISRPLKNHP